MFAKLVKGAFTIGTFLAQNEQVRDQVSTIVSKGLNKGFDKVNKWLDSNQDGKIDEFDEKT